MKCESKFDKIDKYKKGLLFSLEIGEVLIYL